MTSAWIALGAVAISSTLLGMTSSGRWWSPSSGASALSGMAGIFTAFLVVGACLDAAAHQRDLLDPVGLWGAVMTAFVLLTSGAAAGAPWVVKQAQLAENDRNTDPHKDLREVASQPHQSGNGRLD